MNNLREKVAEAIIEACGVRDPARAISYADAAVVAMPFNLLEHLKDAGEAVNENGEAVYQDKAHIRWILTNNIVEAYFIVNCTWKPCVEPELADGWYVMQGPSKLFKIHTSDVSFNANEVLRLEDGTPVQIKEPGG